MLMIAADNAEEVRIDEAKMTDKPGISSDIPGISSDITLNFSDIPLNCSKNYQIHTKSR